MDISVTNQAYIFLSSFLAGMIIGLIFDIFRIIRRTIKTINIITYIQDMLFWIIVTMIIFILVFITNNGELRGYEFLGVLLGVLIYNLLFSHFIIQISVGVINFIKKIVYMIIKIIVFPIVLIYKILKKPCKWIGGRLGIINKKISKKNKSLLFKMKKSIKNIKRIIKSLNN